MQVISRDEVDLPDEMDVEGIPHLSLFKLDILSPMTKSIAS